jgi:hypothetical protein
MPLPRKIGVLVRSTLTVCLIPYPYFIVCFGEDFVGRERLDEEKRSTDHLIALLRRLWQSAVERVRAASRWPLPCSMLVRADDVRLK